MTCQGCGKPLEDKDARLIGCKKVCKDCLDKWWDDLPWPITKEENA